MKISVTVISTPKKGEPTSKRIQTKFSLKEHLEACRTKFENGSLEKFVLKSSINQFPKEEIHNIKEFDQLWQHLSNINFFETELDKKIKVNAEVAKKIVHLIIGDLRGRSGLGDVWDEIDDQTKNEIRQEWQVLVARII